MGSRTDLTTRRRWRTAALAGIVTPLLVSLVGCGDDASPGAAGDTSNDSGEPQIVATFDISGDVTIKTTATDVIPANQDGSKAQNCAEYAKGSQRGSKTVFELPRFFTSGEISGHRLMLDGRVSKYAGPGNYPRSELSGNGNPIGFSIDGHSLVAKEDANVSVTVNADGSGSFTFDTLTETSTGIANPQSITGKMTWTCKNG